MYFTNKNVSDKNAFDALSKIASKFSFPIGDTDEESIVGAEYSGRITPQPIESFFEVETLDGIFEVETVGFLFEEL